MGVNLYFSNQLMPLADKLHANMKTPSPDDNILNPPVVIVPNMNLSKWVKLTLARKTTIFMNVNLAYLETGLWQMLGSLASHSGPAPDLLDKENLKILLFFILMAVDQETADLIPVNQYLGLGNATADGDLEMRAWQLAEELARLFQEYEYHRMDMIRRWLDNAPAADAMEGCQQWIYRKMVALKDQLGRLTGRPVCTLAEYARDVYNADPQARKNDGPCPAQIHFFGLSQLSPLHLHVLSRLKPYFDIHIYSLNPSREYWEDIKTPAEKKWIQRRQVHTLKPSEAEWFSGELLAETDHELLSAWGKTGRESIRLLCQLTDYDFQAGFTKPPPPDTVLAAIGHGLLTLDDPDGAPRCLTQDTSLQVMACPGIRREVETVYDSILYNLEKDPHLCMTDIAVMVSDMGRYKPVVDAVFSRQPTRITYNLVDSKARTESVFAQAVLAVMALSRGNFSRKQVFDLLRNPCVMQRWDYGPEALAVWVGWADALGIFHDYENRSMRDQDAPASGLFSWRQGLERLRIARIMTLPTAVAGSGASHFNGIVPFTDINSGDDRLVETFCQLVEALVAAVGPLEMTSASAQTWRDAFLCVVNQFIEIPAEMRGEETVFQSLVTALDTFVRYDDLGQVQPGRPLTAEALWTFVRSHLEGISGGQGDYLTGGVTVSALMPMRPIPFKVVYVLGLEEGNFPGRNPESLLDLRARQRRIGDITPADRNRYLFLEILISVSRKLYLSYVSRDLQKDRDLAPCSVIQQLRRYVEQRVLGGEGFKIRQIPIRGDSAAYIAPEAVNVWSDVMVSSSVATRISCFRRNGWWPAFTDQATSAELETVSQYCPDFSLPEPLPEEESAGVVPLTIGLLRRFLLDPVEVVGHYHLGIDEPADLTAEMAEMEDEPLASRFPLNYQLRTMPVLKWLAAQLADTDSEPSSDPLVWEFETQYADLSRQSRVPAGAFGAQDKARLRQQVISLGAQVYPFIVQMRSARQRFSSVLAGMVMDDFVEADGAHLEFDPVTIDLPAAGNKIPLPRTVQLSGGLPWVWQAPDDTWHALVVTGSNKKSKVADKYALAPLLTLMALSAGQASCPWSDVNRITLHLVYREHVLELDYPLAPQPCADYLAGLTNAFFTPAPLVWLPFEFVFSQAGLRALIEKDAVNSTDRQVFYDTMIDALQSTPDMRAQLTGAVVTPDILDRARQRFKVFVPQPKVQR